MKTFTIIFSVLIFNLGFNIIPVEDSILKILVLNTPEDYLGKDDQVCNLEYKYLGAVNKNNIPFYYISTISLEFGATCRKSTRLIVYNKDFKFQGDYYTQGSLPTHLVDNILTGPEWPTLDIGLRLPDTIKTNNGLTFVFESE